jgi:hypothetical protein
MLLRAVFFFVFALLVSPNGLAQGASDLMKRVVATYRGLTSYQDSGATVLQIVKGQLDLGKSTTRFSTSFTRNGGYRFAWTSTENFDGKETVASNSCFWSSGSKGWYKEQFYGAKPRLEEMPLSSASAATTGVTEGASHDIFRLLTDEVTGFSYDQLLDLSIVGEEVVSGHVTYKLHGRYPTGAVVDLWIGEQDNLVRKGRSTLPNGSISTVERTNVIVNAAIPTSQFKGCD